MQMILKMYVLVVKKGSNFELFYFFFSLIIEKAEIN